MKNILSNLNNLTINAEKKNRKKNISYQNDYNELKCLHHDRTILITITYIVYCARMKSNKLLAHHFRLMVFLLHNKSHR